jgi:hypothetical protein
MRKRGRIGVADLALVRVADVVRLAAPADLTDAEREQFVAVVNTMPPDYFRPEHRSLILQYIRHRAEADRCAALLRSIVASLDNLVAYSRLLRMQDRESRVLSSLATKLRITPQAQRNYKTRTGVSLELVRPWNSTDDGDAGGNGSSGAH